MLRSHIERVKHVINRFYYEHHDREVFAFEMALELEKAEAGSNVTASVLDNINFRLNELNRMKPNVQSNRSVVEGIDNRISELETLKALVAKTVVPTSVPQPPNDEL